MNKKIIFFIPTTILSILSAWIFLVYIYGDNWNKFHVALTFFVSVLLNIFYLFWLVKTESINIRFLPHYLLIALCTFIISAYFIASPPYKRMINLDLGPDPFFPDGIIGSSVTFYFWEKGFYDPEEAVKVVKRERIKQMQIARQGSLIGHVGEDLAGWSDERIRNAFGRPVRIDNVSDGVERWIYHPWTDHADWEMPVYIKNKVLFKIGD